MLRDEYDVSGQWQTTQTQGPAGSSLPAGDAVLRPGAHAAPAAEGKAGRRAWHWERWLVRRLWQWAGSPPVAVKLFGGHSVTPPAKEAVPAIHIKDRPALWKLFVDPLFQFGELYMHGRLETEGDLADVLERVFRGLEKRFHPGRMGWRWLLQPVNTLTRSRANAAHHYDLGNDFYRKWLDDQMVYTCAYFPRPGMTIEEAQVAKMEHVCRKLRLAPGMTVLEAGCGWGALALHMARHYGVHVTAYNVSREQIAFARERARREGLADRVTFVDDDWRNMRGSFDRFVSVGMLEHVGPPNYRLLGKVVACCLKSNGLGLIHSIGRNYAAPVNAWIRKYIFPGGYAPSLREMTAIFEPFNFSILDVENIRLHYAETLQHWRKRFEKVWDEVVQQFGETFARMWRFYLCCSQAAFQTGGLQLFQVVFAHGSNNSIPQTREDIYRRAALTADKARSASEQGVDA
ncbi:MAG: cyclopropane-fatty-acyl-phospholipid synthase [Pirellulaceae bacterium]|nr:MAG: cyclopropane-fatty-acyl-phospholipid synthase [Pirellulaceae bacterium]